MERHERTEEPTVAAAEIAAHLQLLQVERLAAEFAGLTGCPDYMTDLEAEIADCRHEYVRAAVTEIALLRADLAGVLRG
jgi:hypothetical protein